VVGAILHAGDDVSGVRATGVVTSGPNPMGGPADLMLVAEEPGVGLGARFAGVEGADGAIAARPIADTLKRTEGGERPVVAATVDRAPLWAAETPQAFRATALRRAVDAARAEGRLAAATDCASLIEAVGGRVRLVPPGGPNLKVTTPADLAVAEHLLRGAHGSQLH